MMKQVNICKKLNRAAACVLSLIMLMAAVMPSAKGETLAQRIDYQDEARISDILYSSNYYSDYEKKLISEGVKDIEGADIEIDLFKHESFKGTAPENINYEGKDGLLWGNDCKEIVWGVQVSEPGFYELWLEYIPYGGNGLPIIRGAMIDGEYPYDEAMNFALSRTWQDEGKPRINNLGDEVLPAQVEKPRWTTRSMTDIQGKYTYPLKINLTAGTHKLTLVYVDQPVVISNITFKKPIKVLPYKEVLEQYKSKGYKNADDSIRFEAEDYKHINYKSDSAIMLRSSSKTNASPTSLTSRKYNAIGGYSWRDGNDTIEWNFTVPKSGLYKIGLRIQHNFGTGLSSTRQIAIDGEVPYEEFLEYSFAYNDSVVTHELKDSNAEPYLIYLEEGGHTLSMSVKMGDMTELMHNITEITERLSNTIRNIIMITGQNPDMNYDYELEKSIPSLPDDFSFIINRLENSIEHIVSITSKKTQLENNLVMVLEQIREAYKTPRLIPRRLDDFSSSLTSLGDWLAGIKEQPLLIDYIEIAAPDAKLKDKKESFFDQVYALFANLVLSYTKDYNAIGSIGEAGEVQEVLDIWVSRGEEWVEIMKELIDNKYSPNSKIGVNINILPSGTLGGGVNPLLLAINAGKEPDVAMGLPSNIPVEYAIRNAMYDLSKFSDFDEVKSNYLQELFVPMKYEGGIYGVPETVNFKVLFYRSDIFEQLKLKVPNTWNEVYDELLPTLYQYNLEMYIPAQFDMFIYQNGGKFYTDDGYKTQLGSQQTLNAMNQIVKNFTDYGIPFSANFFNRMRTGEMPIGIGDFTAYMQFHYGAPELTGKWKIAPIPGTKRADGTIDRTVGSLVGTATSVLQTTQKADAAWDFIKWWSEAQTQSEYGRQLESRIGTSARWNTANTEAFKSLPWSYEDIKVIEQSWDWAREVPVVLGSYFTSRHLTNALNRCVINNESVRDSMEEAVKQINRELKRKQESYGIFVD